MNSQSRYAVARVWLVLVAAALLARAVSRPAAAAGGQAACVGGMAGGYPCHNVDLMAFLPLDSIGGGGDVRANNVWGWTDPLTGAEYALQGQTDGTAFIDLSDPAAPVYLGKLPTHTTSSTYRDLKVYQNYAFIVADQPSLHGMQVFDLTQLRDVIAPPVTFSETVHYDGFANGHNLFINEETGFAYVLRTEHCGGALTMVEISDPLNPTAAGCFDDDGLASDTFCAVYHGPDAAYHGREICVTTSDDALATSDVTDKSNPTLVARFTYPGAMRAHHGWMTADHRYFVSADMHDESHHGHNTRIYLWDLADLDNPVSMGHYEGPTAANDHNVWLAGNSAYVGNFRAGLRILDTSNLAGGMLTEEAYFDTYAADDNPDHATGAWAVYPYFESGTILVSDISQGLFVVRASLTPTAVGVSGLTGETAGLLPWVALALAATAALVGWMWLRRAEGPV